jgi:hypothetical protein
MTAIECQLLRIEEELGASGVFGASAKEAVVGS